MITITPFDKTPDGRDVLAYHIERAKLRMTVLDFGGIVQALHFPDRTGYYKDLVCGFDTVQGYLTGGGYHGALIGRYCNRIRDGKFTLNGKEYQLYLNDNDICTLHGGKEGFNVKIWDVQSESTEEYDRLILTYFSPDGEENFPGNLSVTVTYTVDNDNTLTLHYTATTDQDTVVNLTNHTYFNLNGFDGDDIDTQYICLNADRYAVVDEDLLPTGEARDVTDSGFDFRAPKLIEEVVDHSFFLNGKKPACTVIDPHSGRAMTMDTTLPAVQFYTGNFLGGDVDFKCDFPQRAHHAFCLETQFSPDSVNQPQWESTVLRPGQVFDHTTSYHFYHV